MEPNKEQLRATYEKLSDDKIIQLATGEAAKLRPEALEILKEIIKERNLSEDIERGIDIQFKAIDEDTLAEYVELIRNQPCPVCNAAIEKLNASQIQTVYSFIVFTTYNKDFKIACPGCLTTANNNAMVKSALLGWWGLPWGIIRTIQALLFNAKMKKQNRLPESSEVLKAFVYSNLGRIETNRNNPAELQSIITDIR